MSTIAHKLSDRRCRNPAGKPPGTTGPHLALVVGHPGAGGGMEKLCLFLVDTLLSADWRVTIALSGEDIYGDLATLGRRAAVERVDWVDRTLRGDRRYRLPAILDRRRWFRRAGPDVALFVQSSNTPFRASIVGARLAGVPIVTTHRTMPWVRDFVPPGRHFFGLIPGLGLHNRRLIIKTRLTAGLADCIVYNSEQVRHCYEREYGYPSGKGCVVVNAVDIPAKEANSGNPRGEVTIGYVGRLAEEKRIDVLLRAVASLRSQRKVRLLVCGAGPEETSLASLAGKLGISDRVEWCGTTDDVWSVYDRTDIVALCSRRESSSNMVLEAMAAGKAVVVTDVGGLPELIGRGGWGVCVPPGDASALAAVLDRLVGNDDERTAIGVRARQAARERHDPSVVTQSWLGLLADVAGRRAGREMMNSKRLPARLSDRGMGHPAVTESPA